MITGAIIFIQVQDESGIEVLEEQPMTEAEVILGYRQLKRPANE